MIYRILLFLVLCGCVSEGQAQNFIEIDVRGSKLDSTYSRSDMLKVFSNVMSPWLAPLTLPAYAEGERSEWVVWDLVDTSNYEHEAGQEVVFYEGGIYHFASYFFEDSYSTIVYLEAGKAVFFPGLNCKEWGSDIEETVSFLSPKLSSRSDSATIIQRVVDYRSYGRYIAMDNYSQIGCDCDPCN